MQRGQLGIHTLFLLFYTHSDFITGFYWTGARDWLAKGRGGVQDHPFQGVRNDLLCPGHPTQSHFIPMVQSSALLMSAKGITQTNLFREAHF